MQKLLIVFIALFIGFSSIAQPNLDSLWGVWNDKSQADTSRLKAMQSVAWDGYLYSQPDSAYYFAQLGFDFAESVNNKKWMAKTLTTQGASFYVQGNLDKALIYYKNTLEFGDNNGIASSLNNIGNIYLDQKNYDEALNYYKKSLKIREELGDKKGITATLNNIGGIYVKQNIYTESLNYYKKSLKISEEIGDHLGTATPLGNIGLVYQEQGNYSESLVYLKKSLKIFEKFESKKGIAESFINIATTYKFQKNYQLALSYSLNALKISKEINALDLLDDVSKDLYEIYKGMGNSNKALEMYELYVVSRDTLAKQDAREEGIRLEENRKYNEKKIIDSTAHIIAITKEKENVTRKEAELQIKEDREIMLYGGLGLVVLFSLFIFNRFRVTNKQKNVIESQHQKLNETHREITDSINYAKKIQDAIMTSSVYIQEVLPESFIFFQPKDVVSGDFYWVHQSPTGHIYFTVADCTGHGVPGAFMSMIGTALLNENIIENGVEDPAQVLNNLREQIIKALKQENQSESRDGMDMVLCRLDPKKRTLEFAGAFNPVIHIRDNKLTQIKADSQPVALYPGNRTPFSKQTIDLNKGDMIYIFSDGFADQFGGKKDKKYLRSKFYDFLLSISAAPTKQQQQALETEFISWKGENEQIDDVCVMGVRV